MLKRLLILFLAITFPGFFVLNNAHAEGGFDSGKFPYKEMQIQLMPEFDYPENWPKDEPSMLVGYYGTILNQTGKDFNGKIEFPLPVDRKNFSIYLIAEFPEDNKPEIQRPFEIDKEKGVVFWEPGKPIKNGGTYDFVIEYYENSFEVDGAKKSFKFDFTPPAEIEKLDVIVYKPLDSEGFTIDPNPSTTTKSEYGQELGHYQYTDVKTGKALSYSAVYTKEGNESSLSIISKMNPPNDENHDGTASDQTTNGTDEGRPLIDAAGASIIGISIIIAGAFVFWGIRGKRHQGAIKPAKKSTRKPSKKTIPSKIADIADEKKKLRSMLLNGKIDQKTYEEKMKKLI
ncbi:hypothetical protein [Bacillus sp. REN3]|uniref:hypothetical protein n=1 Tax=Bacillus sp. REN3 TaxID=2802440 RepID=UPI001AEE83F2|nr:hypothetical protein [Bacillus sp. REN3]